MTALTAQRAIQSPVDVGVVSGKQVRDASCSVTGSTTVRTALSVASAASMAAPVTR